MSPMELAIWDLLIKRERCSSSGPRASSVLELAMTLFYPDIVVSRYKDIHIFPRHGIKGKIEPRAGTARNFISLERESSDL